MMHGWGTGIGWGFGGGLISLVLLIGLVVGAVYFARWIGQSHSRSPRDLSAEDALRERYARGEISREEYLRIKEDIEKSH